MSGDHQEARIATADSEQGTGEEVTGRCWGQHIDPGDHGKDVGFYSD